MQKILIAGARGGIGRALVFKAAEMWPNAVIFAVARNKALLDQQNFPNHVKCIAADLTKEEDVENLSSLLKESIDHLDLAIHAIGVLNGCGRRPEKSLQEIDGKAVLEAFQVNALSALYYGRILKPLFRHKERSVLMFLSAKVGSIGDNRLGGWYAYRMSKAALNMAVKNMAFEYERSGSMTTVVAVHPGTTLTDLSVDFVSSWPEDKLADPELSAIRLLTLAQHLDESRTGEFMHWDGTKLPW